MKIKNSMERNIVNCRLTLNGGVCQEQVRMIAEDVQFLFKSKRNEKDKTKFLICCTLFAMASLSTNYRLNLARPRASGRRCS